MPKGKDGAGGWCSLILVCLCIINNSKMLFAGTDTHHVFLGMGAGVAGLGVL